MVHRSECPISSTLDILGDKWTLLVVRDLLSGKVRFSEFQRAPEKIASNILTDRLNRLEREGLVTRQTRPGTTRFDYLPTDRAWALRPVLIEMAAWANEYLEDTWVPPPDYLSPSS